MAEQDETNSGCVGCGKPIYLHSVEDFHLCTDCEQDAAEAVRRILDRVHPNPIPHTPA